MLPNSEVSRTDVEVKIVMIIMMIKLLRQPGSLPVRWMTGFLANIFRILRGDNWNILMLLS